MMRPSPVVGGDCDAPPQSVSACSACAGDYEDPDRTAGTPDLEDEEPDAEGSSGAGENGAENEFPAEGA